MPSRRSSGCGYLLGGIGDPAADSGVVAFAWCGVAEAVKVDPVGKMTV